MGPKYSRLVELGHESRRFGPPRTKTNVHGTVISDLFVVCELCGRELRIINSIHLAAHGTTREEYMEEFGLTSDQLVCKDRRRKIARRSDYWPMTQAEVHERLRALFRKHGNVGAGFVSKNARQVIAQATQMHGSWRKAVAAAGLETWLMQREKEWTKDRVLQEIRKVYRERGSLQLRRELLNEFGVLPWYATRFFGGWRKAVIAAGIELEEGGVREEWSKEKVRAWIHKYKSRSLMPKRGRELFDRACTRYYGSPKKAFLAVGREWEWANGATSWSRKKILEELRRYREVHGPQCASLIASENPNLRARAFHYFGTWRRALRLAGITAKRDDWTKETLARELRHFLKNGRLPTWASYTQARRGELYNSTLNHFGSWPAAIYAAGMKHQRWLKPARSVWTEEQVLSALRGLSRLGLRDQASRQEKLNPELFTAIKALYGSWRGAWAAASSGAAPSSKKLSESKARRFFELEKFAEKRGGAVLSMREYLASSLVLQLLCSQGHVWNGNLYHTLNGTWCKQCTIEEKLSESYERVRAAALKAGGECLTNREDYHGLNDPVHLRCKLGHEWKINGQSIAEGRWCQKCYWLNKRVPFEKVKAAAKRFGGACLSPEYLGFGKKLQFRCKAGHEFESDPAQVLKKFHCQECKRTETLGKTFERLEKIVERRGGRVLASDFDGWSSRLDFECKTGHRWNALASSVLLGQWCAKCYHESKGPGIGALQKFAEKRSALCLSKEYKTARTPYLWRCVNGHEFKLSFSSASEGSWCHACRRPEKSFQRIGERGRGGSLA